MSRRRRTRRFVVVSLLLGGLAGCNGILNLDHPTDYVAAVREASDAGYLALEGSEASLPDACTPAPDDRTNCGRCGRACGADSLCVGGRCAARTVVSPLLASVTKLVVRNGRGYFSLLTAPVIHDEPTGGTPAKASCFLHRIYAFALGTKSEPVAVGWGCSFANPTLVAAPWDASEEAIFTSFSYDPPGALPTRVVRFDGGALDDAAVTTLVGVGTPIASAGAPFRDILADPVRPDAPLLLDDVAQTIFQVLNDGGTAPELVLIDPASNGDPFFVSDEGVLTADPAPAGFAVISSATNGKSTTGQRVWSAPRGCLAPPCAVAETRSYASHCGVRRIGGVVRWCGIDLDSSGTTFRLLLLEMDTSGGAVRIRNSTKIPGVGGEPIIPRLHLDENGIYLGFNVTIDLLPNDGPLVPVAAATAQVFAMTTNATHLYWAQSDAIYEVAK